MDHFQGTCVNAVPTVEVFKNTRLQHLAQQSQNCPGDPTEEGVTPQSPAVDQSLEVVVSRCAYMQCMQLLSRTTHTHTHTARHALVSAAEFSSNENSGVHMQKLSL